jgi:lysophospholipase L1-like esterase
MRSLATSAQSAGHPNASGYAVMAPLAARAIEQSLAGTGVAPQASPQR